MLPDWLSEQKARLTADWLHLSLLTAPRVAASCNVSLRMYLGDLFDHLVILMKTPDTPISPCISENFHIRYRDMPDFEAEDLLKIFKCGMNSVLVLLQQECHNQRLIIDFNDAHLDIMCAFKHLRHTELEAFREHRSIFTHFSGFESDFDVQRDVHSDPKSRPKESAYPWASRTK